MILKEKLDMADEEICDVEKLVFTAIAEAEEKEESQRKAFMRLINSNGEEIVKLCYTNEDGSKIEEVNKKFRFQVLMDFPNIMEFVFETPEKQVGKPQPQRIKKR